MLCGHFHRKTTPHSFFMNNSSFWSVKDGFPKTNLIPIVVLVISIPVVAYLALHKETSKAVEEQSPDQKIQAIVEEQSPDQKIQAIVEEQSPDDFTGDNASELSRYAGGIMNGNLLIGDRALLLLIRAFTFGRGETLSPNYTIASNLVEVATSREIVNDNNPDLLFLRSTITARTASSDKDLTPANQLLELAARKGSFEALAKLSQGGFSYCVNPTKKTDLEKKKLFDELLSPGSGGPTLLAFLSSHPIVVIYTGMFELAWKLFGDEGDDNEGSGNDPTKRTISFLRTHSDYLDAKVSDPLALLEKYDAVRTASYLAEEQQDSEEERRKRIWMFLGHNGGTYLGSPKLESYRRVIVCTKEPCLLFIKKKLLGGFESVLHLEKGSRPIKRTDDFLVMPAGDIECYNREITNRFPRLANNPMLKFDSGHPKNGCTYVQHPHRKNEYVELSEFSFRILKEKAAELDRVLSSLGATEISLSVLDSDSMDVADFKKFKARLEVAIGSLPSDKGEADARLEFAHSEFQKRKNGIHIEAKRIGHAPSYPEGPSFPFFEESNQLEWKTLAQDVCKGQRKVAKFRLTYVDEYHYDTDAVGNLGIAVRNGIQNGKIGNDWQIKTSLQLNKYLVWECEAHF